MAHRKSNMTAMFASNTSARATTQTLLAGRRLLHTTPARASTSQPQASPSNRRSTSRRLSAKPGSDLVGPPDAQSNIRPVVYGSAFEEVASSSSGPSNNAQRPRVLSHPYSTSEFSTPSISLKPHSEYYRSLLRRLEVAELEHHLRRSRVDRFSQNFWADNNVRYTRDMLQYQSDSSGITGKGKDELLAPFNAAWLDANSKRHKAYNDRLWAMTKENLVPALRYSTLRSWIGWVRWAETKLGRGPQSITW